MQNGRLRPSIPYLAEYPLRKISDIYPSNISGNYSIVCGVDISIKTVPLHLIQGLRLY